jgi:hypothetical protein
MPRLYEKRVVENIKRVWCLWTGRYGGIPGCNIAVTAGFIPFTTAYSTVHKERLSNKLYPPPVNVPPSHSQKSKNAGHNEN